MPLIELNETYTIEYCDNNWLYFDGYCYFIKQSQWLNFKEAAKMCYDKNSNLLSIHSQHESNWILEQINEKRGDMWIGLNKLNRQYEGYRWSDNSPVDFVSWGLGQPRYPSVNRCVVINAASGRWSDRHCYQHDGYICKRKNGTDSFTTTLAPTVPTVRGGCLGGFVRSTFNSKCYGFFKKQKTWSQAKATCQAYGKTYSLVTIQSKLEQMLINSLLYDSLQMVWIGLTNQYPYLKYTWDDGSEVAYTNWNFLEPNENNGYCVDIFVNNEKIGEWKKERCRSTKYFICQGFQNPLFPIDTSESVYCPLGYRKYDQMCYKLFEVNNDWNTSLSNCQEDGGSLASILNFPEKSFVSYLTYNKSSLPFWIGLNNMNSKDGITYKWSNGWPVMYTHWNSDYLPSKPCIAVGEDFWIDKDCDTKLPALCQINKKSLPKAADQSTCQEGGYVFGDKCYYPILHNPLTWVEAKKESWSWVESFQKTFENWNSGEPSSSWRSMEEECVEMRPDGTWNDINCQNYERPFICSGDTDEAVTTSITTTATTKAVTNVAMETTEVTTTTPAVAKPRDDEFISQKRVSGETTGLTTGQIIGIVIGIFGCFVIVAAILFILRFSRQNESYQPNTQSFVNALYLKTSEENNEEDQNAMGSTVQICGSDPL